MEASAGLPAWATPLAWALALAVLAACARRSVLERVRAGGEARRVLLAATLAAMALRWFNTAALQGVVLHFLGATVLALMFGGRVACWIMALASLAGVVLGAGWQSSWPADFLLSGALPVAVTLAVGVAAARWVPANIFTYVMVNAFGAGALAMAASSMLKAAIAAALGVPEASFGGAAAAYLVATPLLMFGEAFLSGGIMVLLVVYRPQWCASFDDRLYLGPGRPM
ncbi:energy-coupling factor ABC transporter permease [Luteimonas sp. MJ246]|uniref:energy-coupling factor ABC transporter permease n=1 Tax=Luteimonas sp. MJ174 TaxID=3129237 RepID=UPI0031BBA56A